MEIPIGLRKDWGKIHTVSDTIRRKMTSYREEVYK